MSTRTQLYAVSSIEPIRAAIGSNDNELVEAIVTKERETLQEDYDEDEQDELEEELEEFREMVEEMILGTPPKNEPGCWALLFEHLASHLKLDPAELPLDDWKHSHVWESYRGFVDDHVSKPSKASLRHLDDGRPLNGRGIDYDGCVFGWLSAEETAELCESISQLDPSVIKEDDLRGFHTELVECLSQAKSKGAAVWMGAQ